jgi:hypothetical protein
MSLGWEIHAAIVAVIFGAFALSLLIPPRKDWIIKALVFGLCAVASVVLL